jgi:hypothetical protein
MASEKIAVCGKAIQYDKSSGSVIHCWESADEVDCPPSIQEEIAAEIIDGGVVSAIRFLASNGVYYRW